jgi:hypothetical protein
VPLSSPYHASAFGSVEGQARNTNEHIPSVRKYEKEKPRETDEKWRIILKLAFKEHDIWMQDEFM